MLRTGENVKLREPNPNSFQALFGKLVRRYREKAGLKQMDVARLVYRDEEATSRVSDVERGRHCPQADTIASFRAALKISEAEVEACWQQQASQLSDSFLTEIGLAEGILESLALRFGHEDPSGGRAKLMEFLRQKAREYNLLKEGMEAMAQAEHRASNQILAAKAAIERGNFAEADHLLEAVEEIQQSDRTFKEIRKQAAIRELRGDAALLSGNALAAYSHFTSATEFFEPFSPRDASNHRRRLADRLSEQAERYTGDWDYYAASLLQKNEAFFSSSGDKRNLARTKASVGRFMLRYTYRTSSPAALDHAEKELNAALVLLKTNKNSWDWFTARTNLAAVYRERGSRDLTEARLTSVISAEEIYNELLMRRPKERFALEWAIVQLDLGRLLAERSRKEPPAKAIGHLRKALECMENAQPVLADRHKAAALDCGCTRATTLLWLAELLPIERSRLARMATEQFEQAASALSIESEPLLWANMQIRLALLYDHDTDDFVAIRKSIKAMENSLSVFTYEANPDKWAECQGILIWSHFNAIRSADTRYKNAQIDKLIKVIRSALKVIAVENERELWLLLTFSLGLATAVKGFAGDGGGARRRLLDRALDNFAALLPNFDDELDELNPAGELGELIYRLMDEDLGAARLLDFASETLGRLYSSTKQQPSLGGAVVATLEGLFAVLKSERVENGEKRVLLIQAISSFNGALPILVAPRHQIFGAVETARNRAAAALALM